MDASGVDREWDLILDLLPEEVGRLARGSGAVERLRGVDDARTLLRLFLIHAGAGLSLRKTVGYAKLQGFATISDVALMDRLRKAEPWLREITRRMFASRPFPLRVPELKQPFSLRAVDATTINEPGASGTTWRIHYVLQLPELTCDFIELTGTEGGETYTRLPVKNGDLILADRGYCHREGVAHVVDHGGVAVVRLNLNSFPLLTAQGQRFGLLRHLRRLDGFQPREWAVRFVAHDRQFDARLCAIRKSEAARERAQKRILRRAQRNGTQPSPEGLEAAGYVYILATASVEQLSTVEVLDLYRLRWQVELAFKRLKSLLNSGYVPKYDPASARSWIQAKLLTALLIERLMTRAGFFSPWGFEAKAP